jgi:hypothetical protein
MPLVLLEFWPLSVSGGMDLEQADCHLTDNH